MHADDDAEPADEHAWHSGPHTDLRARKKLATRKALSDAALHLALERGPENVRVEDIAAAAGVSPRTYNNYFSCREEAILEFVHGRARRIGAGLRARPADEPLDEAIVHTMREYYVIGPRSDKAGIRLMSEAPMLRGEFLKAGVAMEEALADAIAARTGLDPDRDLFPRVLASAVCGAVRVGFHRWLRSDEDTPLADEFTEALIYIMPAAQVFSAAHPRAAAPARAAESRHAEYERGPEC